MRRWSIAVLPALAVIGLGCGTATGPGGLIMHFEASRATMALGDTVVFTLRLRNATSNVQVVSGGGCTLRFAFDGVEQNTACTDDLRVWRVPPRGEVSESWAWTGIVQLPGGPPMALGPGTYAVRGIIDAFEGRGRSSPVHVTVVAR